MTYQRECKTRVCVCCDSVSVVSGVLDIAKQYQTLLQTLKFYIASYFDFDFDVLSRKGCFVEERVVDSANRDPKNAFEMLEIVGKE